MRFPRNNKATNGVRFKKQVKKTPKQDSAQRYYVLRKKSEMPEQKYMLHNSEDCFCKRSNQNSIKDGLRWPMGSRAEDAKQYKNSKNKCKKDLKVLNKKKKL